MKGLIKNLVCWFISIIIFSEILEVAIKVDNSIDIIGISIIIYPIICLAFGIVKYINQYRRGEYIQFNRIYQILLTMSVANDTIDNPSISKIIFTKDSENMVDSIVKAKNSKRNMLFNILINTITIISLLLIIESKFTIIVIMYVVLILVFLIISSISSFKETKKSIDGIIDEMETIKETMSKEERKRYNIGMGIAILALIVIFIVIPWICGIIITEKQIGGEIFNEVKYEPKTKNINVKDDNYQESGVSEEDKLIIEEMINQELKGEIVYKIINIEENQKNEAEERYNKITIVANLESDSEDEYSYDFIIYKYLTASDVHKKGEIEIYTFWQTDKIKKQDWYSK